MSALPEPAAPAAPGPRPRLRADHSGIVLLLVATAIFMGTSIAVKRLSTELPMFQIIWGRMVFHFLIFLPLFLLPRYRPFVRPNRPWMQIGRSAILFATNATYFTSLAFLTLSQAASIMYASPLIVVILSALFLGERTGPRRLIAVAVGFVGVIVIMRPGIAFQWAMLLPLAAAVTYALYQLTTRRLAADDHPFTTMFWTPVVGIAATAVILPFVWTAPAPEHWLLMVSSGATAGVGQFLLILAFARSEASLLAPFGYSTLIWAALAGIVFFGNFPDLMTIVGAAIVVLAGLYIWWRERQIDRARRLAAADAAGAGSAGDKADRG